MSKRDKINMADVKIKKLSHFYKIKIFQIIKYNFNI